MARRLILDTGVLIKADCSPRMTTWPSPRSLPQNCTLGWRRQTMPDAFADFSDLSGVQAITLGALG